MRILVDSYSESNGTIDQAIDNTSPFFYTAKGQSFTGKPAILDSCVFQAKKVGTPTGNAYAKIYAHTGTYGSGGTGTGPALATSDAIDVSTLSTSLSLITWNFSGDERIILGTGYYVVVIEYENGDSSNYISLRSDNIAPTHDGNLVYISNGSWSGGLVDVCFYVYGEELKSSIQGISQIQGASSITF